MLIPIRFALLVPPILAAVLGTWVASLATTSASTGLDAVQRPWFFLIAVPAQLGGVLIASTVLASWYWGPASVPGWARRSILTSWRDSSDLATGQGDRSGTVLESARRARLGLLASIGAAAGLAVSGALLVLVAVPTQVAAMAWLAYLTIRVIRSHQ